MLTDKRGEQNEQQAELSLDPVTRVRVWFVRMKLALDLRMKMLVMEAGSNKAFNK
jgi:hypothetical protein